MNSISYPEMALFILRPSVRIFHSFIPSFNLLLSCFFGDRRVGITRGVNKYHIIRATLESIAYQVNDVLNAMKADSGINLAALKVDGGASANNFLMQTQADIINAPVNRPCCVETTAMGAAYLAGLAVGYWSSKEEVRNNWSIDQKFYPSITEFYLALLIKCKQI